MLFVYDNVEKNISVALYHFQQPFSEENTFFLINERNVAKHILYPFYRICRVESV